MQTDEKNLEGGQEQETTQVEEGATPEPTKTDPLDSMSEDGVRGFLTALGVEVPEGTDDLLAFAKKERAIKNRHAKKELETNQPSKKDDDAIQRFEKANERRAIRLIESSEDPEFVEINENWSDIVANYVPRRGRDTEEDILDDIQDAYAIWKRKSVAKVDTKGAESNVMQTKGVKGNSPSPAPQKKEKIIKRSEKMADWFKD